VDAADFVTDFADQAVLLPLAIAMGPLLAYAGWRQAAHASAIVIPATLGIMLVLKLTLATCGYLLPGTLHSPSGHTAAAGAIYGSLLAIVARRISGRSGWTLPCATLAVLVIGASRLILGVHTLSDVVIGGLVGILGAMAFARLAGQPPAGLRLRPILIVVLLVVIILHGVHLPAEAAIQSVETDIWSVFECR
jgi:membrane-associated phospholipid phosphatase